MFLQDDIIGQICRVILCRQSKKTSYPALTASKTSPSPRTTPCHRDIIWSSEEIRSLSVTQEPGLTSDSDLEPARVSNRQLKIQNTSIILAFDWPRFLSDVGEPNINCPAVQYVKQRPRYECIIYGYNRAYSPEKETTVKISWVSLILLLVL